MKPLEPLWYLKTQHQILFRLSLNYAFVSTSHEIFTCLYIFRSCSTRDSFVFVQGNHHTLICVCVCGARSQTV